MRWNKATLQCHNACLVDFPPYMKHLCPAQRRWPWLKFMTLYRVQLKSENSKVHGFYLPTVAIIISLLLSTVLLPFEK